MLSVAELKSIAYAPGDSSPKAAARLRGGTGGRGARSSPRRQRVAGKDGGPPPSAGYSSSSRIVRRPRRHPLGAADRPETPPSPQQQQQQQQQQHSETVSLPPIDPAGHLSMFVSYEEDEILGLREPQSRRLDEAALMRLKDRKARRKDKNTSPFLEYEDLEARLRNERRWLLEDSEFVAMRKRGLVRNTVQARLGRSASTPTAGSGMLSPTAFQASAARSSGPGSAAPVEHGSSTASRFAAERSRQKKGQLLELKGLQKEMQDSAARVQKALVTTSPP